MSDSKKDILWRVYLLYFAACLFGVFIVGRIFIIQFVEGEKWQEKSRYLTTDLKNIEAIRGNIYAEDGSILATSIPVYEIRMDTKTEGLTDEMFRAEIDSLSWYLSRLFQDLTPAQYARNLREARQQGKRYHLIRRDVNYNQVKELKSFPIFRMGRYKSGLIVEKQNVRKRPYDVLAARTIGYDREDVQPVGIEGAYHEVLRGQPGKRFEKRLAGGIWMPIKDGNEIEPIDGSDVITSLDINIQDVAENALKKQLILHNADHGCVILMEVETGFVKAIANLSNRYGTGYYEYYNYAIGEATEPGSTFKLPALMAAFEDGYAQLDDSVDTKNGKHKFHDSWMRDSNDKGYGKITLQEAFEKSSNVGISRVIYDAYSKSPQKFIDRLHSMGLNNPLGVSIAGEGKPAVKNVSDPSWSGISLPWISIGYEVLQTPLQILAFYNAVANDGVLVRPQFVTQIVHNGTVQQEFKPVVLNPSIASKPTIEKARIMLESVVSPTGTASNLHNSVVSIAGKTGTAQIANDKYGYRYEQKVSYQASFVGYFPTDKPKYSCIVVVNGPSNNVYYGNQVAGPIFKEVALKIYAKDPQFQQDIYFEDHQLEVGVPLSKSGNANDLKTVFDHFGVPVSINDLDAEWVHTQSGKDRVEFNKAIIRQGMVPNVLGMCAQDAIFLMENSGVGVLIEGKGMVKRQSIQPGERIHDGMRVKLELS
jgi:cell division protein FtsI (penicillin-binding protein 3)